MFAVKLAIQTGWDERAILRWPWPRLALYLAADRLEPFGGKQEDRRSGEMLSLFYNANRSRDAAALKPEDWYPSLAPPPEVRREHERAVQVWRGRLLAAQIKAAEAKAERLKARKKNG